MTDRELLELAAKAAGIKVKGVLEDENTLLIKPAPGQPPARWNPLTDDGDALRLAVQLRLTVEVWDATSFELAHSCCTRTDINTMRVRHDSDPYAATRRAIVRAAAEIGKEMK